MGCLVDDGTRGNGGGSAPMCDNWLQSRSGGGLTMSKPGSDPGKRKAPRIVLAGLALSARVAEHFRQLGWEVCTAIDGADARRLALRKRPNALILPAQGSDESGYLTCAKLRQCLPKLR